MAHFVFSKSLYAMLDDWTTLYSLILYHVNKVLFFQDRQILPEDLSHALLHFQYNILASLPPVVRSTGACVGVWRVACRGATHHAWHIMPWLDTCCDAPWHDADVVTHHAMAWHILRRAMTWRRWCDASCHVTLHDTAQAANRNLWYRDAPKACGRSHRSYCNFHVQPTAGLWPLQS